MRPDTVHLLRSPHEHEPLRLAHFERDGAWVEVLVGVESGQEYPVVDGIPVLLDEAEVGRYNRRYRRFYDRVAPLYDRALEAGARAVGGQEGSFREEYLSALELFPGARFLEVSVGTGANLGLLPADLDCYGLDISLGMLHRCQHNLAAWGRSCELVQGDAQALPFVDDAFDAVLHVGGINAFDDRELALAELARVARPGSRVVVADETARLIERLAWFPGARRMLRQHADRFEAPVHLLPPGAHEIEVREVARGGLYCLSFRVA